MLRTLVCILALSASSWCQGALTVGSVTGSFKFRTADQKLLKVSTLNTRYLVDFNGNLKLIGGLHQWFNVQNISTCLGDYANPTNITDFASHITAIKAFGHNFTRLWNWETSRYTYTGCDAQFTPELYERSGTSGATAGGNKFDLDEVDEDWLDNLEARVAEAYHQGVTVSVMFFQGLDIGQAFGSTSDSPWTGHPYHSGNNINSLNGDPNADGRGYETHSCSNLTCSSNPAITRQKELIAAVLERLAKYPNWFIEFGNEVNCTIGLTECINWFSHLNTFIHTYTISHGQMPRLTWATKMLGATSDHSSVAQLLATGADMVSNSDDDFPDADAYAPTADYCNIGRPLLNDSDHYDVAQANPARVWQQALRGCGGVILMDCYPQNCSTAWTGPNDATRYAVGDAISYINTMGLNGASVGSSDISMSNSSTSKYLKLFPTGNAMGAQSFTTAGTSACEWWDATDRTTRSCSFPGTGTQNYTAPNSGSCASGPCVLYVH